MTDDQVQVTDLLKSYTRAWDDFWDGEQPKASSGPKPNPYWRASSMGRCLRYQCLKRAGVTPTRVSDDSGLRRMELGREHHWQYRLKLEQAGFLLAWEIPVVDEHLHVSGHVDIVWGGEIQDQPDHWWYRNPDWQAWIDFYRKALYSAHGGVIPVTVDEVKSTGSYGFRMVPPSGRSDQMLQLATYKILAERHPDAFPTWPIERYEVVLINRDNGAYREPIPLRESWVVEAEERLGRLNQAWASGDWPECTCGLTEDIQWELNYCDFPNEGGDGCCGTTLLDRLEASVAATAPRQEELT